MHYADYKTILSPNGGMNIYRGCTHGCIYCDSRSDCYQMKHAFEDIEVKRDAPEILERQLRNRRRRCLVSTGAMCDPYIPLEVELRYMRRCLSAILRHGFGVAVQTKSARILRDLDLLTAINRQARCIVQTTLTTCDEDLCRIIEPDVSTTVQRVDMLKTMRDNGIPTIVWLSPLLPFINDTEENIRGLMDYCVQAGVRGIIFFGVGVTLRSGDREYFYGKLDEHFPGTKQRYINAFGNRYICSSPDDARLSAIVREQCKKHCIMYKSSDISAFFKQWDEDQQLSL